MSYGPNSDHQVTPDTEGKRERFTLLHWDKISDCTIVTAEDIHGRVWQAVTNLSTGQLRITDYSGEVFDPTNTWFAADMSKRAQDFAVWASVWGYEAVA